MEKEEIEKRVSNLIEDLFTNGFGEEAVQLKLISESGRDLGGWSKAVVKAKLFALLTKKD